MGLLNERGDAGAEITRDLLAAARREVRMECKVIREFNAGWARGKPGETIKVTEAQAALLTDWLEPIRSSAPPARPAAVTPEETPPDPQDDVPGAPPRVMNTMISSKQPGGDRKKRKGGLGA